MHCCDIARSGQSLPSRLPEDWSPSTFSQRERTASLSKPPAFSPAFALLNRDLQETLKFTSNEESAANEIERKNSIESYEEKRRKNHEVRLSRSRRRNEGLLSSRTDTKNSNDVDNSCVNRRNATSENAKNEVEHRWSASVEHCFPRRTKTRSGIPTAEGGARTSETVGARTPGGTATTGRATQGRRTKEVVRTTRGKDRDGIRRSTRAPFSGGTEGDGAKESLGMGTTTDARTLHPEVASSRADQRLESQRERTRLRSAEDGGHDADQSKQAATDQCDHSHSGAVHC